MEPQTADQRHAAYSGLLVTVDAKPAKIVGYCEPFATVTTWGAQPWLCAQFSWATVARIVAAGGTFRTA